MNTHVAVATLESGEFDVQALQGHVSTRHRLSIDEPFLDRIGLTGQDPVTVVEAVCDVLIGHEALTAVPRAATLEQLVVRYPFLVEELQQRLMPGATGLPVIESVRILPVSVEDRPTHT